MERVSAAWPQTEFIVLRPDVRVLDQTRPNPLSTHAAVPAFLTTLQGMRHRLADEDTWPLLSKHLLVPGHH